MAPILLSRPNKLAFPGANVLPGINPAHVASKNIQFSAVSIGANFINLLNGQTGVATGTSAQMDGALGNTLVSMSGHGVADTIFAGQNATNFTSSTIAAIIRKTSSGGQDGIFANTSGSNGVTLDVGSGFLEWLMYGAVLRTSTVAISLNVPYFVVGSQNGAANVNYLALRLDTGQITTGTTLGGTPVAPNGTYVIANSAAASGILQGQIAAVAYTSQYLTMQQLLQWAQDPWAFWYPQQIDLAQMLSIAPALGLPAAAGLLQTRSVPGLGPQSRHTALLNASLPTPVAVVTVTGGTLPIMGVG